MSFSKKHGRQRKNIRCENANLLAEFKRFAKGADLRRANHYFASSDKFTACKFHILREARKFRLSQAALNFKI